MNKPVYDENSDIPCQVCKRKHRKLWNAHGILAGKNCAEQIDAYMRDSNVNSITWRGWKKTHAKIKNLFSSTSQNQQVQIRYTTKKT